MLFYRDGAISEQAIQPFDLSDRGLLLGDGVFDTAMVLGGRIFRAAAHLDRLLAGARELGIDAEEAATRRATETLSASGKDGILRTTLTRGPGPRGLRPHSPQRPTLLASFAALPANVVFMPLTLDVAAIRRNESSPTSRLKTLSYLDAVLATGAAAAAGFDEALFLNCAGRVACAASGNIFAVRGREIVTPPVTDGVLPGIIRAFILEECGGLDHDDLGLDRSKVMNVIDLDQIERDAGGKPAQWSSFPHRALERSLDIADLLAADAVFVTSSVKLIAPVTRIGGTSLQSDRNPVVTELQTRLRAAIGAECGVTLPPPGRGIAETLG